MNIFFIHVRDHDESGELLNFGGATLAYWLHRQADSLIVDWAMAECTPEDRFVKRIGKAISTARLEAHDFGGTIEVPNTMEDCVELLVLKDYLAYKEQYWVRDEPDLNIKHHLFPHRSGSSVLNSILEEEEEEQLDLLDIEDV